MSFLTRARVPGPVGTPGGLSGSGPRPRYLPGLSRPGSLGLSTSAVTLLAEAGHPDPDVATDAHSGASVVELIEPEPVFGQAASLQNVNLPLFAGEQNLPEPADMVQGALNNCPVAAVLTAMAHVGPETVAGMIVRSTADVRSHRRSDPADSFPYRTDRLYTVQFRSNSPLRVSSFLYYTAGEIAYAHSPDNRDAWMSYIEKAYAVWRGANSYNRLNTTTQLDLPPSVNQVMEDMAGTYDFADLMESLMYRHGCDPVELSAAMLRQMLTRARHSVTVAASRDGGIPETVAPNHAYAVLGVTRDMVSLRNPQGGTDAAISFSFSEFQTIYRAVLQASSAGT